MKNPPIIMRDMQLPLQLGAIWRPCHVFCDWFSFAIVQNDCGFVTTCVIMIKIFSFTTKMAILDLKFSFCEKELAKVYHRSKRQVEMF